MQLKLRRSQREGGLSRKVIFCLDARAEYTAEERAHIQRYRLHNEVIYSSEAARQRIAQGDAHASQGSTRGHLRAIASFAVARLHLNITIASLTKGQHIECKDLDELLSAENALYEACEKLKQYLDTAATFDGREVLFSFDGNAGPTITDATPPKPIEGPREDYADYEDVTPPPPLIDTSTDVGPRDYGPDAPRPSMETAGASVRQLIEKLKTWDAQEDQWRRTVVAVVGVVLFFIFMGPFGMHPIRALLVLGSLAAAALLRARNRYAPLALGILLLILPIFLNSYQRWAWLGGILR